MARTGRIAVGVRFTDRVTGCHFVTVSVSGRGFAGRLERGTHGTDASSLAEPYVRTYQWRERGRVRTEDE